MSIKRYSPGSFGAMTEDVDGKYVRIEDAAKLANEYRNQGVMAGSFLADENADELRKARELLRWRDAITDMPTEMGEYLVRFEYGNEVWHEVIRWVPGFLSMGIHATHWRPIGPPPEVNPWPPTKPTASAPPARCGRSAGGTPTTCRKRIGIRSCRTLI